MKFERQKIDDLTLITPEKYSDNRGIFNRHFCKNLLSEVGINFTVCREIFLKIIKLILSEDFIIKKTIQRGKNNFACHWFNL